MRKENTPKKHARLVVFYWVSLLGQIWFYWGKTIMRDFSGNLHPAGRQSSWSLPYQSLLNI